MAGPRKGGGPRTCTDSPPCLLTSLQAVTSPRTPGLHLHRGTQGRLYATRYPLPPSLSPLCALPAVNHATLPLCSRPAGSGPGMRSRLLLQRGYLTLSISTPSRPGNVLSQRTGSFQSPREDGHLGGFVFFSNIHFLPNESK